MRVTDPSGQRWLVRRRWRAEHLGPDGHARRLIGRSGEGFRRSKAREWADLVQLGDLGEIPVIGVVFVVIAVLALMALAVLLIVPVLIAIGELLLVLVLGALGLVARLALRRPWTVEAVRRTGIVHRWSVPGWSASGRLRQLVAEQLTSTGRLPEGDSVAAAIPGARVIP